MDLSKTVTYEPVEFPGVQVVLRKPSLWTRMEAARLVAVGDVKEIEEHRNARAYWQVYVHEVKGVSIDGKDATTQDVFEYAPQELPNDVLVKIVSLHTPMVLDDQADQLLIESYRRKIEEAEKRIAERKNSEPGSSPGTSTAVTLTVDAA